MREYLEKTHELEVKKGKVELKISTARDGDDATSMKQDPIEDTQTKILSPTIQQMQNATHTTNKFSNFGFFGGASSPRATAVVGVTGNIENQDDEMDIEVSIEDHFSRIPKNDSFGFLCRYSS